MQRHVAMETTMIRDKDLQLQEAERQRDEAMEQYSQLQQTMLIDQNRQMLLNQSMEEHRMTMPTEYREASSLRISVLDLQICERFYFDTSVSTHRFATKDPSKPAFLLLYQTTMIEQSLL